MTSQCRLLKELHNLGNAENRAGNHDLALQHWMFSATLGYEKSLSKVKTSFMKGLATKADYAAALRGYQNAVEEIQAPTGTRPKHRRIRQCDGDGAKVGFRLGGK